MLQVEVEDCFYCMKVYIVQCSISLFLEHSAMYVFYKLLRCFINKGVEKWMLKRQ